jgi:carboxyl-terminal processing protease
VLAVLVTASLFDGCATAGSKRSPSRTSLGSEVATILAKQHFSHPDVEHLLARPPGDVDAVLATLNDPETRRLSREELALFIKDTTGAEDTTGLGLTELLSLDIGSSGAPVVVTPVPGSSASVAGLRPQDEILSVGGRSTDGVPFGKVLSWLREDPAPVQLAIRRAGKTLSLVLNRDSTLKPREHLPRALQLSKTVGYLRLEAFYEGLEVPFRAALSQLSTHGTTWLVLDLRDNPGGAVSTALEVIGALAGPIAAAQGFEAQGSRVFTGQIVVLIDEGTASAAELVSSALQAAGRATLVGTHTFGKGLIHAGADLSDGSMLIVSAGHLVTPSGRNILKEGIAPDLFVATPDLPTSRQVAPPLASLNDDPQVKRAVMLADGTTSPGVR